MDHDCSNSYNILILHTVLSSVTACTIAISKKTNPPPDSKEMPIYSHSRVIPLFEFLHTGDDSIRAEICCFIVETNVHVFQ